MAGLTQALALVSGPAVLPDDRGRYGFECLAVPQDKRLSLIGDADRRHIRLAGPGRAERRLRARLHSRPDLVRVVLDPSRPRIVLRDLGVTLAPHLAVEPDGDRRRARRAF